MHRHILVPTDGSDGSMSALAEALDLADASDATVHALYVVDQTTRGNGSMAMGDPQPVAERREVGERATAEMARQAADAGIEVTAEVRPGIPDETIIEYAEETGIDVIVMASHGRSGVRRFVFGSVTERVTRGTDIPVVVVKRDADESEAGPDTTVEPTHPPSSLG